MKPLHNNTQKVVDYDLENKPLHTHKRKNRSLATKLNQPIILLLLFKSARAQNFDLTDTFASLINCTTKCGNNNFKEKFRISANVSAENLLANTRNISDLLGCACIPAQKIPNYHPEKNYPLIIGCYASYIEQTCYDRSESDSLGTEIFYPKFNLSIRNTMGEVQYNQVFSTEFTNRWHLNRYINSKTIKQQWDTDLRDLCNDPFNTQIRVESPDLFNETSLFDQNELSCFYHYVCDFKPEVLKNRCPVFVEPSFLSCFYPTEFGESLSATCPTYVNNFYIKDNKDHYDYLWFDEEKFLSPHKCIENKNVRLHPIYQQYENYSYVWDFFLVNDTDADNKRWRLGYDACKIQYQYDDLCKSNADKQLAQGLRFRKN